MQRIGVTWGRSPYYLGLLHQLTGRTMASQRRRLQLDAAHRELRGVVIALLMVAATTAIAYTLVAYLDIRRGSVIYLIPVLLAG